jgi:hypothetical protein
MSSGTSQSVAKEAILIVRTMGCRSHCKRLGRLFSSFWRLVL